MVVDVVFEEVNTSFDADFSELYQISNDRYEEGYNDGVKQGYSDGYDNGLAARTYETWTITLVDGYVVENEVALL